MKSMERDGEKRVPAWVGRLLIRFGPMLVLWLWWALIWGVILTPVSWIFFVLIPGLIATRLIFLFCSRRRARSKVWRTALWAAVFAVTAFLGMFSPYQVFRKTHRNAPERYEAEVRNRFDLDETLRSPDLGEPKDTVYYFYYTSEFIFESRACGLICTYDEASYPAQKAVVESRVPFRTEPLDAEYRLSPDEEVKTLEPRIRIGSDEFRFAEPKDGDVDYDAQFYKNCLLVVTNDETRQIGYVAFRDIDLDMAYDLEKFIRTNCGWSCFR